MAWTDLTFPAGSVLTATKMTQLDENFDALAAQNAGAPLVTFPNSPTTAFMATGVSSLDRIDVSSQLDLRASSVQDSGYSWLPNNMLLQWAVNSVGGQTTQLINFPIAFPNGVFSVVLTDHGNTVQDNPSISTAIESQSTTGFYAVNSASGAARGFDWMAIGN